jgi:hypothetical protein
MYIACLLPGCHGAVNEHEVLFQTQETATATHKILETVNGNKAVPHMHIFDWFRRFKEEYEDLQHDPRCGRPSTARKPETVCNNWLTGGQRLSNDPEIDGGSIAP